MAILCPPYNYGTGIWNEPQQQISRSQCSIDDVKKALKQGLDPNVQWNAFEVVTPPAIGRFVPSSFDPDCTWANYNTPLHKSLWHQHYDAAALLLESGARIDLCNALGRTVLHEALNPPSKLRLKYTSSHYEKVKFLIENGANINAETEDSSSHNKYTSRSGIVPLHEAIRAWDLKMVKILVEAGASLTQLAPGGWTILDLALLERNEPIIDFLYKSGARLSEIPNSEVEPTNLREMAQALLADNSIFPSPDYREAYLHVISHPEFLCAWKGFSTGSVSTCRVLLETFLDILSRIAEKPNPENVPGAPTCVQCAAFLRQLSLEILDPFELYPDRDSLRRSAIDGCCLCALFEDALVHKTGRWAGQSSAKYTKFGTTPKIILLPGEISWRPTIIIHHENQSETLIIDSMSDSFMIDHQQYPDDTELGTGSARAFETACSWLENCRLHHSKCNESKDENPMLPTRVIDVGNETSEPLLYQGNGRHAPYVCLSYCCGSCDNLKTTKESLLDHMNMIPLRLFPPTLRDAVLATRQLGFRFLWIDALCIIQDDENDKEREVAQMQTIFANATVTLSAHDSRDSMGGLFRPRRWNYPPSPVQISLRIPKQHKPVRETHKYGYFIFPVHGEKELYKPGPLSFQAWALQGQFLSTRIIHWGPGILYWECLSCHGSESDPEGITHPYTDPESFTNPYHITYTNCTQVRRQKRIAQGRFHENDLGYSSTPTFGTLKTDIDIRRSTYLTWQGLVSEYSSRVLAKQEDKIPAFLGLSRIMERALQDKFVVGIWKNSHFFPSLLWAADNSEGNSRNGNYPFWTWASINGKIKYPIVDPDITWEPSDVALDIKTSGPSQSHATGSITMRSTIRKFSWVNQLWHYKNKPRGSLFGSLPPRIDREIESRWPAASLIVQAFQDIGSALPELRAPSSWEDTGDDIYCLVVARIGLKPPPKAGSLTFPDLRPESLVCICITPVRRGEETETKAPHNTYRRVGLCEFRDQPEFWKDAVKGEWVTII
ncbi:hypothetical protein F4813DRAFT_112107 [Daldinia decipiens]|uniref:uncharacterized protein n=1 Tax=Daldinia decipiens TaxID=326647 RepID=UPI0020C55756|nr:uncharacterized protein F4813DRAFT_112107 [Daldinia decipiens]KAI1656815.1 hypothetical protein F4813DRAFT_112107 [Daldinia decipiens]